LHSTLLECVRLATLPVRSGGRIFLYPPMFLPGVVSQLKFITEILFTLCSPYSPPCPLSRERGGNQKGGESAIPYSDIYSTKLIKSIFEGYDTSSNFTLLSPTQTYQFTNYIPICFATRDRSDITFCFIFGLQNVILTNNSYTCYYFLFEMSISCGTPYYLSGTGRVILNTVLHPGSLSTSICPL